LKKDCWSGWDFGCIIWVSKGRFYAFRFNKA